MSFHHMLVLTQCVDENVITRLTLQTELIEPAVRPNGFVEQMGTHVPLEHYPKHDVIGEWEQVVSHLVTQASREVEFEKLTQDVDEAVVVVGVCRKRRCCSDNKWGRSEVDGYGGEVRKRRKLRQGRREEGVRSKAFGSCFPCLESV